MFLLLIIQKDCSKVHCTINPSRTYESVETITASTYFRCRTTVFWLSVAFVLVLGVLGSARVLTAPELSLAARLAEAGVAEQATILFVKMRGVVMLGLVVGWPVAFLLRLACARYLAYFATAFISVVYFRDMAFLLMSEDWLLKLTTSHFFFMRPFAIGALLVISFSLAETIRFERRYLPAGKRVLERRET